MIIFIQLFSFAASFRNVKLYLIITNFHIPTFPFLQYIICNYNK